jgi:DNA helicase-2/ATP-dependent DNA helicase PcrA
MSQGSIVEGLNAEQRRSVECLHDPICILAGAGSGKTTTTTRRIAQQVVSGEFGPQNVLAVTFTTNAAGELAELARPGCARRANRRHRLYSVGLDLVRYADHSRTR